MIQIIGGDADVDHSQTIGGDTAKLLGKIYPPLVSAPLILRQCHHPPLHIHSFMNITFSACQFKQVWCWDVDQMLYFTLEKHKK